MAEQEYKIAKKALLEILQDEKQSAKEKIKAAELLIALQDCWEKYRWTLFQSHASNQE